MQIFSYQTSQENFQTLFWNFAQLVEKRNQNRRTNCENFIKTWMSKLVISSELQNRKIWLITWIYSQSQQRVEWWKRGKKMSIELLHLTWKNENVFRCCFLCDVWLREQVHCAINWKQRALVMSIKRLLLFSQLYASNGKFWTAQLEPSPTKEKNKFRIFRVHEQTKNKK